jgi:hypothetical protein
MKTTKIVSFVLIVGIAFSLLLTSCENNPEVKPQEDILPKSFRVDIPSSISNATLANGGRLAGRTKDDSLKGNDIYQNLGTFIAVGEEASKLVEAFIEGIRKYKIDRVLSLTYVGDDDNRTKNLVVVSNSTFEGTVWDYQLTITDADSESQPDGGKALQIFWNKTSLIKGTAIIKPYNCDRLENANAKDAVFRIDYSEGGDLGYDAQMEVLISGLPLSSPLSDPYSISTLRMFAGKKGDVVDVYGNSNHPNAMLFSGTVGFNWAFVAAGNETKDVGVAEVGLPPSSLNSTDRKVLLKDYSIKNVFTNEINAAWPGLDPALLDAYLSETAAPGYFSKKNGFLSGGVSPGADWDGLTSRLDALSPYNPKEISELVVVFK